MREEYVYHRTGGDYERRDVTIEGGKQITAVYRVVENVIFIEPYEHHELKMTALVYFSVIIVSRPSTKSQHVLWMFSHPGRRRYIRPITVLSILKCDIDVGFRHVSMNTST